MPQWVQSTFKKRGWGRWGGTGGEEEEGGGGGEASYRASELRYPQYEEHVNGVALGAYR